MTLIVHPDFFRSKRALRDNLNENRCNIYEPSIMGEWVKRPATLPVGFSDVVTNHPKRTKFARITKTVNGWKVE